MNENITVGELKKKLENYSDDAEVIPKRGKFLIQETLPTGKAEEEGETPENGNT